jgi:hypothetical protein
MKLDRLNINITARLASGRNCASGNDERGLVQLGTTLIRGMPDAKTIVPPGQGFEGQNGFRHPSG